MNRNEDLRRLVALHLVKDLGPLTLKKLLEHFGNLEAILKATASDLKRVENAPFRVTQKLLDASLLAKADEEIAKANKARVEIIAYFDSRYPESLKSIHSPPNLLYVKGVLPLESTPRIGIVGSREASYYGQKMAKEIAEDLARAGVVIVSGLARGIDAAAHEGTLAGQGITLAVLGSGISKLYPPENEKLAQNICEKGALISEYPMDMPPLPEYFPLRNRIISGLSRAVLVVEAREKSGALITAELALQEGRDVYAIPGNADSSRSNGTNKLIKEGAKLVTCAEDILKEWNLSFTGSDSAIKLVNTKKIAALNETENRLLNLLGDDTLHVDDLIEKSSLPMAQAISTLSVLEIKGCVKQLPGKIFRKIL